MSDPTEDDTAARPFLIVAVGASAGGLAPTQELVRELGPRPEVAVVVIHHLDPSHESGLIDILSRATSLPVLPATDGSRLMPNHVYVMEPGTELLVQRGVLATVPRDEAARHLPIDRFFASLALDQAGLAVAVVLSGTGFDGAQGVKAIKSQGGIALVQDASALHPSMPESAIATGCVDAILPAAGLARELVRLGRRAPSLVEPPPSSSNEADYRRVLAAVRKSSGVDFSSYKQTTIRRRLERRLVLHGIDELGPYVEMLARDPAEVQALCDELLIHVTSFFREPEAFDSLTTSVFPKLCDGRRRDTPIRVWVPGCSSGEEVYSIAMSLLEYLEQAQLQDQAVKIFGTDLSAAVIDRARVGRYPESIAAEVAQARLVRFFTKDDRGYRIRQDVRDLCVFAKHDVTRDPPFSGIDLVSCRNLMIYLGAELQDRVVTLLHYALNEPGFLLLGGAETVRAFAGFVAVDGRNKIYARTSAAPRMAFDFTTSRTPFELGAPSLSSMPVGTSGGARSAGPADIQREADRVVLSRFGPPGVVVTEDLAVVQFRGHTGPFMEHVQGTATLDLLRLAREELRFPLRRALDRARASEAAAREDGVVTRVGNERRTVALEVVPFAVPPLRQRFFVVLFEDVTAEDGDAAAPSPPAQAEQAPTAEGELRRELSATRQYLESVIEQGEAANEELKAANEEIVSSNEELRSTNEELQSAKEELQATNEELRTLSDEMRDRGTAATRLSDDLTNVLSSVEIPILIAGRDGRLRRFTPSAARLFRLVATDLGRPLGEITSLAATSPALVASLAGVLETLRPAELLATDADGRWHEVTVRPYITLDGRIDGTVIAARDVDNEKRAVEELAAAKKFADDVIAAIRDGLVVVDHACQVRSANDVFLRAFDLDAKAVVGRRLGELGRPALACEALAALVQHPDGAERDLRLEHGAGAGAARVFVVNARPIETTGLVLVTFVEVTAAELSDRKIRQYQEDLRRSAFEAALAEERERRRLSIELHDGIGQSLALAQIKLTSLGAELAGAQRATLDEAIALLEQALAEKRAMAFDLSPPVLYDLGLGAALVWLSEDFEKRHGLKLEIASRIEDVQMDTATKAIVFRTIRELVMNVLKHAGVTEAKVAVASTDAELEFSVEDGGIGFDPEAPKPRGHRSFGLLSAREQILRLGGTFEVTSAAQEGTRVRVVVPLQPTSDVSPRASETGRGP